MARSKSHSGTVDQYATCHRSRLNGPGPFPSWWPDAVTAGKYVRSGSRQQRAAEGSWWVRVKLPRVRTLLCAVMSRSDSLKGHFTQNHRANMCYLSDLLLVLLWAPPPFIPLHFEGVCLAFLFFYFFFSSTCIFLKICVHVAKDCFYLFSARVTPSKTRRVGLWESSYHQRGGHLWPLREKLN